MTEYDCQSHECSPIAGASFGGLDPALYFIILLAMLGAFLSLLFLGYRYYTRGAK